MEDDDDDDVWRTPWGTVDTSFSDELGSTTAKTKTAEATGRNGILVWKGNHDGDGDGNGHGNGVSDRWGGGWDVSATNNVWDGVAQGDDLGGAVWGIHGLAEEEENTRTMPVAVKKTEAETEEKKKAVEKNEGTEKKVTSLLLDEQEAWGAASPQETVCEIDVGPETPSGERQAAAVSGDAATGSVEVMDTTVKKSRVQKLVVMYDGIARDAVGSSLDGNLQDGRKAGSASAMAGESVGESFGTTTATDQNTYVRPTSPLTTPQEPLRSVSVAVENIAFPINLSLIDMLFPSSAKPPVATDPHDIILCSDTFGTTSERRTWYRISRLGSIRRHDSGGDDNYRLVSWSADSAVRTQTLRTVRRWMEQDSIAGRVVLGGGGSGRVAAGAPLGASMFNWDSSEPAVEIGELLRRSKTGRGGESGGGGDGIKREGHAEESSLLDVKDGTRPVAVKDSGWLLDSGKVLEGFTMDKGVRKGEDVACKDDNDDDEDWGEMVSSPTAVESGASFAPKPAKTPTLSGTQSGGAFESEFSGLEFFEAAGPDSVAAGSSMARMSSVVPPSAHAAVVDAVAAKDDTAAAAELSIWTPSTTEKVPRMPSTDETGVTSSSVEKPSDAMGLRVSTTMRKPADDNVSSKDGCTTEERRMIEEVLGGLADLSYMLR